MLNAECGMLKEVPERGREEVLGLSKAALKLLQLGATRAQLLVGHLASGVATVLFCSWTSLESGER